MTPPRSLILTSFTQQPAECLNLLADHLWQIGVTVNGVNAENRLANQFAYLWCERAALHSVLNLRERVYRLDKVTAMISDGGFMRPAASVETVTLQQWACAFHREAIGINDDKRMQKLVAKKIEEGDLYIWMKAEKITAMAAKTRETVYGAVVGLVYTPHELRGKGYASQLVTALSSTLLGRGFRFCALFTDADNPISNSIYQKIGYYPLCDMQEYLFKKDTQ